MMPEQQMERLNKRALFADETLDYRIPEEPDEGDSVVLRFRTGKDNTDHVYCISDEGKMQMKKTSSDSLFDYYEIQITAGEKPLYYYFQAEKGDQICFYDRLGTDAAPNGSHAFCITPGFHTPEWAKGAVMYQIYIDRFCNGDPDNDVTDDEYIYIGCPVQQVKDWNAGPEAMDVGRFYGGDLQGVWDKLDYLQYLGIEVIYFNPLFVSPSNHKYDSQDYEHIDPHFGVIVRDGGQAVPRGAVSNEDASRYRFRSAAPENLTASDAFFAEFVEELHRRGMRVIIDGVFNHCGSFNKWLDREKIYEKMGGYETGAYVSEDSPYRSFFRFNDETAWPDNDSYDGWWGHDTLPKLNYEESDQLYDYVMSIARKWVSPPFNVDGWRLDVAADLGHSSEYNHKFWRDFRKNVKEANPEAIILAEHYGDPGSWLAGDQWDTVMNYDAFMEPLTWFLTGMEKHSDEYNGILFGDGVSFFRSMNYHMARMKTPSLLTAMNQLSNHDHSRFLTRTNQTVGRLATAGAKKAEEGIHYGVFREAVMVQMTWPGAPTLYYGDEAGVCGWTDPDNRRTYPWGHENFELIEFYSYMIRIHKGMPALRRGSIKQLLADRQLIAYGRIRGKNKCVVAVNNRNNRREIQLPVWELGITDEEKIMRVMLTEEKGYNAGILEYYARDGILALEMPAHSSILLVAGVDEAGTGSDEKNRAE